MKIVEYDDVDPLKVLHLNRLALDFALTPERAAHIRKSDPRPFPCLAIYAVEDEVVMGQVGIFRLPMVTTEGREDVGGIWAVSTHPQYSGRGVASMLIEEAHNRMRKAGLRFSTLGTNRFRRAYTLYCKVGYQDTYVWAEALAPWEIAHQPTRLRSQAVDSAGHDFIEQVFQNLAQKYLGFSWRHIPFERLRALDPAVIQVLWQNDQPVGYALAQVNQQSLNISDLVLKRDIDATEAVAAVSAPLKTDYVYVSLSRPGAVNSLRAAGFQVAQPNWSAFMIKPLAPELTLEHARRLFGIGTDRFLISWLDTT